MKKGEGKRKKKKGRKDRERGREKIEREIKNAFVSFTKPFSQATLTFFVLKEWGQCHSLMPEALLQRNVTELKYFGTTHLSTGKFLQ